jgi:hypothetical protein
MSQTKPLPLRHTTAGELLWRVFSADLPRGEPRSARILCRFFKVVISQDLDLTLLYADWTCQEINSLTHSHLVVFSLFL